MELMTPDAERGGAGRLEALLATIDRGVARALERALAGVELGFTEGLVLARGSGPELAALAEAADITRRQSVGDVISYVVNCNINFTNICYVGCRFCAFSRAERDTDSYFLSPEEVAQRALAAWERGAREVCIQGGLPRRLEPFYYRDLLGAVRRAVPGIHVHAFSPMEILHGVRLTGMPLTEYLSMLKEAGLHTMPGTAAEILDDRVRARIERLKLKASEWVEVVKAAHRLGIRTTATMMYGHTESEEHWVAHLILLRRIQEETGGFTEFVPLGFVAQNTRLFQSGDARPGPTAEEHLKVHALSRLMLRGRVENIQVSWVKMSRRDAQRCLCAGANDYGGTLMYENISRLAGSPAGEHMTPAEFRRRIRDLHRIPAERTTTYETVRLYGAAAQA